MRFRHVQIGALVFFLAGAAFQTAPAQPAKDAKTIYRFSENIAALANERIWAGFSLPKYASLKSENGNTFIHFSAGEAFSWMLKDEYFLDHLLEEDLAITFHEAFHAFQRDEKRAGKKWGAENSMLVFEYQESSAQNNALFSIEGRILRAALQTKGMAQLKRKITEFITVRDMRQQLLDPRFAEFEMGAELNEGLAEYAGTKAVVFAIENSNRVKFGIPFETTKPDVYLKKKFGVLDSISGIGKNVRLKFYYTGAAQGFLLDRLIPDWKTKVQMEGETLQDLLGKFAVEGMSPGEIERLLKSYDYDEVLQHEEARAEKRRDENQALLEKTLNKDGRKVTIDFSKLAAPGQIRFFDPMNVTMIRPGLRVHTRSVSFTGSGETFFASFEQPVVEDLENRRYEAVVDPELKLVADGKEIDLSMAGEFAFEDQCQLTADGVHISARRGVIKITGGQVEIVLFDKN